MTAVELLLILALAASFLPSEGQRHSGSIVQQSSVDTCPSGFAMSSIFFEDGSDDPRFSCSNHAVPQSCLKNCKWTMGMDCKPSYEGEGRHFLARGIRLKRARGSKRPPSVLCCENLAATQGPCRWVKASTDQRSEIDDYVRRVAGAAIGAYFFESCSSEPKRPPHKCLEEAEKESEREQEDRAENRQEDEEPERLEERGREEERLEERGREEERLEDRAQEEERPETRSNDGEGTGGDKQGEGGIGAGIGIGLGLGFALE